ncbi:MAG: twin-arginine translocase TatA/TatE family subunit [Vulcanimicrobiota bacterium]
MAWTLGPTELIVLLVIALVVFGPKRLPELGEAFGKGIKSFKNASKEPPAEADETV